MMGWVIILLKDTSCDGRLPQQARNLPMAQNDGKLGTNHASQHTIPRHEWQNKLMCERSTYLVKTGRQIRMHSRVQNEWSSSCIVGRCGAKNSW
jgi:hypothetical protein